MELMDKDRNCFSSLDLDVSCMHVNSFSNSIDVTDNVISELGRSHKSIRRNLFNEITRKLEMQFEYRRKEHISGLSTTEVIYELSIGIFVLVILLSSVYSFLWSLDWVLAKRDERKKL